jgi:hypothetical protein
MGILAALGAQYAEGIRQKQDAKVSDERNAKVLEQLQAQKAVNAQSEQEFREKFQAVLVQLDAAKHEDSKKITEEKIRVIQKDFAEWATNFVNNYPALKVDIDRARLDSEQGKLPSQISETKKEIQISEETFSVISFAVRNVQELVRNYSERTGSKITVASWELPQNFYEKPVEYEIRFNTNAVWKFHVEAYRPAGNFNHPAWFPSLRIAFKDFRGKDSGSLTLETKPTEKKFWMNYESFIPKPDPAAVAGDRDLSGYETPVREVVQQIIEAQLVQATE